MKIIEKRWEEYKNEVLATVPWDLDFAAFELVRTSFWTGANMVMAQIMKIPVDSEHSADEKAQIIKDMYLEIQDFWEDIARRTKTVQKENKRNAKQ